MRNHNYSPDAGELAFTDYASLLTNRPDEAKGLLEDLLVNPEALGYYIRFLEVSISDPKFKSNCTLDQENVFEILSNGLRNVSTMFLSNLVFDGDALSELQCLVLEIDDPGSFWCEKQAIESLPKHVTAIDSDRLESTGSDSTLRPGSFPIESTDSIRAIHGSVDTTDLSHSNESRLIRSKQHDALCGLVMLVTPDRLMANSNLAETSPFTDQIFCLGPAHEMSRLNEYLDERLDHIASDGLSPKHIEAIRLLTLVRFRSLAKIRKFESISVKDIDFMLWTAFRHVRRFDKHWLSLSRCDCSKSAKNEPQHFNANGYCVHRRISNFDRLVLMKRFVEYEPIHQISRDLGLDHYRVKRICDRARSEVLNGCSPNSHRNASSASKKSVISNKSSRLTKRQITETLKHIQIYGFWIVLGAVITALVGAVNQNQMIHAVSTLAFTYASVICIRPLVSGDTGDEAARENSGSSLHLI